MDSARELPVWVMNADGTGARQLAKPARLGSGPARRQRATGIADETLPER